MLQKIFYGIILILPLFFNQELFAGQTGDSLVATISLPKKMLNDWKDLQVSLSLHTSYKKDIFIAHDHRWGYIQDSIGDILLQVQKKSGNAYQTIKPAGRIDYPVPTGNTPLIDTLANETIKKIDFFMGLLFQFERGVYRVRVLCIISPLNDNVEDVYSNWFYFYSDNRLLPHH